MKIIAMKVFRKLLKNLSHEGTIDEIKSTRDVRSRNTCEHHFEDGSDSVNLNSCAKSLKLHTAVSSEREAEIRKYATKRNINDQDAFQRTALHLAVVQNNLSVVQLLLSLGASAEIYDNDGFTPFLRAVEIGNIDLVKLFWSRKLNKTQTDLCGNTALHIAVKNGFYKIVDFLVRNNGSVNIPNELGDYPLHTATQNESFSIAKILLENQASVDVEDKMKRTPLLLAVKIGNLSLVELFTTYNANRNQCDVNGMSVKDYALLCKHFKIRALIISDHTADYEAKTKIQFNDEDSQTSERSCVLPPILEAPKSWKVLHPNDRPQEIKKLYRRNVKSLSPDFLGNPLRSELSDANRRKSFSFSQLINSSSESTKLVKFPEEDSVQYENCRKALDELSLEKLRESVKLESEKEETQLKSNKYLKLKSDQSSNKLSMLGLSQGNVRNKYNRKQTMFFNGHDDALSDSSEEDPPFWKNSLDGGYFTGDPLYDSRKTATSIEYSSSTSEENSDSENKKECTSDTMLNRLKQVTQENQDLETETAVLREAAEKLKYDLANYRLLSDVNESDVARMKAQITQLDSKYLKAIQKINSFQMRMNNMQQEIVHLRSICDESHKINQQLIAERTVTRGKSKGTSFQDGFGNHQNDVHKLQKDVTYWRTKYEEITNSAGENHTANFNMQHLVALNVELNRLNGKIKDCLSKADLTELQNQHEILAGKMMHQVLEEANRELQSSIAEIKRDIECKLSNDSLKSESHPVEMENKNKEQKMLSDISRLKAVLEEKENNEQRLRNQLSDLRDKVAKLVGERRKTHIEKAIEDDYFVP